MKKFLLVCLLSSFSVFASEATKKADIEQLLGLMHSETMINSMYGQMNQMMQNMGRQLKIKPDEQAIFNKFYNKMFTEMKTEMNWQKMKQPMIDIYVKHFNEQEIKDMIAFYKTPSGQSMIKKLPAVMNDSMMMGQNMMKSFIPKMRTMSKELQAELKAFREKANAPK